MHELLSGSQRQDQRAGSEAGATAMHARVSLLDASGPGIHAWPDSDLVSVSDTNVSERAGMAGATDGPDGDGL